MKKIEIYSNFNDLYQKNNELVVKYCLKDESLTYLA